LAQRIRDAEADARAEAEAEAIERARERARAAVEEGARREAELEELRRQAEAEAQRKAEEDAIAEAAEQQRERARQRIIEELLSDDDSDTGGFGFVNFVTGRPVVPIRFEPPEYPMSARRAGVDGYIRMRFTVGVDGKAKNINVLRDTNGRYFRRPVMDSIQNALFQPAVIDGDAFEQDVVFAIRFVIADE
jgi:TonB family protein